MFMRWVILTFIGILLVSGCVAPESAKYKDPAELAKAYCILMCQQYDYDDKPSGPCISERHTEWNVDDWVCDIAHSPREEIDNLPENQCQEFIEGRAHHFVEVTPDCELIRAV